MWSIIKKTFTTQDTQIALPFASIAVEDNLGLIQRLAQGLHDRCHQSYVDCFYEEPLHQRALHIACRYEDATPHAFKAGCER